MTSASLPEYQVTVSVPTRPGATASITKPGVNVQTSAQGQVGVTSATLGRREVVTFPTGSEPSLVGIPDGTLWVEYSPTGVAPSPSGVLISPDPVDAAIPTQVTLGGFGMDAITGVVLQQTQGPNTVNRPTIVPDSTNYSSCAFTIPALAGLGDPIATTYSWAALYTNAYGTQTVPFSYEFRRDDTRPGYVYCGVTQITGSDATNAAKLAGLGFVPGITVHWAPYAVMTVHSQVAGQFMGHGFHFFWDGSAWQPLPAPTFTSFVPTSAPAGQSSLAFHVHGTGLLTNNVTAVSLQLPGGWVTLDIDTTFTNTDTDMAFRGATDPALMKPGDYSVRFTSSTGVWESDLSFTLNPLVEVYNIAFNPTLGNGNTAATVTRKDGTGTGSPVTLHWCDDVNNPNATAAAVLGTPVLHNIANPAVRGTHVYGIWATDAQQNWGVIPYGNADSAAYGFTATWGTAIARLSTRLTLVLAPTSTITMTGGTVQLEFGFSHMYVTQENVSVTVVSSNLAGTVVADSASAPAGTYPGLTSKFLVSTTQTVLTSGQTYTVELDVTFGPEALGIVRGGASVQNSVGSVGATEMFSVTVLATTYPDASTTGPKGTLTPYDGDLVVAAGQTVRDLDISGRCGLLEGASLINCRVRGIGEPNWVLSCLGAVNTVTDVEIGGGVDGVTFNSAIAVYSGGQSTVLTRLHIHHTSDGMRLDGGTTLQDSYIHTLVVTEFEGVHSDGIQCEQADFPAFVNHNTIEGGTYTAIYVEHFKDQPMSVTNNKLLCRVVPGVSQSAFAVRVPNESGLITCTNNVVSDDWLIAPFDLPDGSIVSGNTNLSGQPVY